METVAHLLDKYLSKNGVKSLVAGAYGGRPRAEVAERLADVAEQLIARFPETEVPAIRFLSTPGRSELGGNHTDHNHGCVVAASIELDALAAVVPTSNNRITLQSKGFEGTFEVDLSQLSPEKDERGGTQALIRGVAARCKQLGYEIGGFNAYLDSRVLPGSGMSSSAAIEVLLGTAISALYNGGSIDPVELAKIGQYAENEYMGKPCGLMDQIACAHGGVVAIDFAKPTEPEVTGIELDLHAAGYRLAIIDTGGSHEDLTDAYAAVPEEMRRVAEVFGRETLRGLDMDQLLTDLPSTREKVGDRALLRAIHFVRENERAQAQRKALEEVKIERFLELLRESGLSSWRFLQNCVTPGDPTDQSLALALGVAETLLGGRGAARVHGGGFAGTMQVFLPIDLESTFVPKIEELLGKGIVTTTGIRPLGTVAFPPLGE